MDWTESLASLQSLVETRAPRRGANRIQRFHAQQRVIARDQIHWRQAPGEVAGKLFGGEFQRVARLFG